MNKTGLALAVVLVVVLSLLGAPFATGIVSEQRVVERIESMDSNPWLSARVTAYERGWFGSRASIEIGLSPSYIAQLQAATDDSPALDLLSTALPIEIEIAHGPIVIDNGLHLAMAHVVARSDPNSPLAQQVASNFNMPYLFEFRGQAGFGRRFDFEGEIPAFDFSGPQGDLGFSGIDVTGAAIGPLLQVDALADSLTYESAFATGAMQSASMHMDYEFRADALPLSMSQFRIERIVASSPMLGAGPLFEANELMIGGDLALDDSGEFLRMSMLYSAASLAGGQEFAMTDAALGIAIENIDAVAAQDYYRIMSALTAGQQAVGLEAVIDQLGPVGETILAGGPRLAVRPMQFSTELGSLDGNIDLSIDTSGLPPGQAIDLRNIAVLISVLTASVELNASKPLAQQLAALAMRTQIQMASAASGESLPPDELTAAAEAQAGFMLVTLAAQGMLVDDGERYSTTLEYANTGLTVNGAPLPLNLF